MAVRIVIADDHALVRAGLRMILEAEPDLEVVGEAADGNEACDIVRAMKPDVVLMDVRMPRVDGLEATRRLSTFPDLHTRVVVLTTFDLDEYVYDALRAGASGFLLKNDPPAQLIAGIRVVAAGDALLAPSVTKRLIAEFANRRPASDQKVRLNLLTTREREVLELVASGLSNVEIAQALSLGEATVKSHFGRILDKLELRDRAQAVAFAYEAGVRVPGATDATR